MYVLPDHSTHTLRVTIGAFALHLRPDDALTFAHLLRRPPNCGMFWCDALNAGHGLRLRAAGGGAELLSEIDAAGGEWISWEVAVDIAGEITGSLGRLRLPQASD